MAGSNRKTKLKESAQPQPPTRTPEPSKSNSKDAALPLARYTSVLGTQSLLLVFTALFLPRSTVSFLGKDFLPQPTTSADRPQHAFMEPLTASSVLTMGWLCAGVALVMAWSAGYMRIWARGSDGKGDDGRVVNARLADEKSGAISDALKASGVAALAFYVLLVLFGAPINSHHPQTLLLATLISLLIVYPPVYALGLPPLDSSSAAQSRRLEYVRLFSEFSIRTHLERALVYPAVGTVVGCWLGAFVLPLDWDRPWQAWPLVPAYMAIMGHIIGSAVSLGQSMLYSLAELDKSQ